MFRLIEHRGNNDLFVCVSYGQIDTQITSLYIFPLVRRWRKLCPFPPIRNDRLLISIISSFKLKPNAFTPFTFSSIENGFARRRVCAIVVVDKHFPLDLIIITINYEQYLPPAWVWVRARSAH